MRQLTSKPFGVNIAQAFVRDPDIVSFVVDQGVKFVTTSAGDPNRYCSALKAAGLTVFHVVPSLAAALKAIDAGVDGLVVEGGEGGGFKNRRDVAIDGAAAAGLLEGERAGDRRRRHRGRAQHGRRLRAGRRGRADGHPHGLVGREPGAFQLEERHPGGAETDTVFLNRFGPGPALRALRTEKTTEFEKAPPENIMREFGHAKDLYFGGDMEASIALSGQVAGPHRRG